MDVEFPYEHVADLAFGPVYRPVAKVTFTSPTTDIQVTSWMIIDTGADFSMLPLHYTDKLRISLEADCTKDIIEGVGGTQVIYLLKKPIHISIGKVEREVPIAFFDSNEVPALLGRLGFLETFDVTFSKKHLATFRS